MTTEGREVLKLDPDQVTVAKFAVTRPCAGLFMWPGFGKTVVMYAVLTALRQRRIVRNMLVLAPRRVCHSVWPQQAQQFEQFRGLRVHVLHGKGKDEDALFAGEHNVYVMNPEGLPWLSHTTRRARRWPFDMLVMDESTKFKHTKTDRFKTLKPLLSKFKRRYALTGTPAPNGLLDLFGQVYALDYGATLGRYITHYRMDHFYQAGYGGYTWVVIPGHDKKIFDKMRHIAVSDYGRPNSRKRTVVKNIYVDLPEKVRPKYRAVERDFLVALESGAVVAANAAVAGGKCRQIAGGAVYLTEEGKRKSNPKWEELHEEKVDAAIELIAELNWNPLLLVYEFAHERDRLLKRIKGVYRKEPPVYGGRTTDRQALRMERDWNAGEIRVMLAQWQSVAHGLNLQFARRSALCAFTVTWDLELYIQAQLRLNRRGRQDQLRVFRILTRDTLDERVPMVLSGKNVTQENLLGAIRLYGRKSASR